MGQERITIYFECSRILLPAGAGEAVAFRSDPNVDESGLLKHSLPNWQQQTTGNSSTPKIDVADSFSWYWLAIGYISKLNPPARTEHSEDL